MDSNISIVKTVVSTNNFNKVVDTSFKTFTQPVPEEDPDTPEELFRLYEKLYYSIDITGETDSHEYLIKKSSELVTFYRAQLHLAFKMGLNANNPTMIEEE